MYNIIKNISTLKNACLSIVFMLLTAQSFAQADPAVDESLQHEREELIMTALEALLSVNEERAFPLAKKLLNEEHSRLIKSRALFVIGQIDLPEAQQLLLDIARDNTDGLGEEAIRMIGVGGNANSLAQLNSIYQNGDSVVRQRVLEAYLIAGDSDAIYELALQADNDDDYDSAINLLGAMGAHDKLRELGHQRAPSASLIQAYAIAGDLDSLMEFIEDTQGELRVQAITQIGIIGDGKAARVLADIYQDSPADDVRQAALNGLLISGDSDTVLELYQNSQSNADKKDLLRILANMNPEAALDAIDLALEGK